MFERFTERARRVMVLAQDEAVGQFHHNFIAPEHLLLGLMREQKGKAAQCLASFGLTVDGLRGSFRRISPMADSDGKSLLPTFTPGAKKSLELSLREALSLDVHYIGTEHILLGVLSQSRDELDSAKGLLGVLGIEANTIRAGLLELLGVSDPRNRPERPRDLPPDAPITVHINAALLTAFRAKYQQMRRALGPCVGLERLYRRRAANPTLSQADWIEILAIIDLMIDQLFTELSPSHPFRRVAVHIEFDIDRAKTAFTVSERQRLEKSTT